MEKKYRGLLSAALTIVLSTAIMWAGLRTAYAATTTGKYEKKGDPVGNATADYDVTYWIPGEGPSGSGRGMKWGNVNVTLEGHESAFDFETIYLKTGDAVKLNISGSYNPDGDVIGFGDDDGDDSGPVTVDSFGGVTFSASETMKNGTEPEIPITIEEVNGDFYVKANHPGDADISVSGGDGEGFSTFLPYIKVRERAEVTTPPTAITGLIANGATYDLIDVASASATDGDLKYALGEDDQTEPSGEDVWDTMVPTGTEAGTYYVWYKAFGDTTHSDSVAVCIPVTIIATVDAPAINSKQYNGKVQIADVQDTASYTVTTNDGGTNVTKTGYPVVLTLTDTTKYKWSDSDEATKTLYFMITKAPAVVNVPTLSAVTYDPTKTLADVALPTGWTWKTDSIVPAVVNSGYDAVLSVDDDNYDYTGVIDYDAQKHEVARTVSLTVNKADISKAKVTLAKTSYVFNGNAKEPKVKSVVLDGRTLVAATDYTVSYKNNTKTGIATVVVSGIGSYVGTAEATFKIVPAKVSGLSTAGHPSKGMLDVSWKKVAGASSYELSWRAAGHKWPTKNTKSVKGTSATIEGLKAGKCYEVRVRAKAGSVTGAWSKKNGRWLKKVSSIKAAEGSSKGSIKVGWAKNTRATGGYVIKVFSKKGSAAVAKKEVSADKTSVTISGLTSGKAYYVKVRPVRKVSNTKYVGVERYFKSTVKAK